jgi:hypothetical protein
VFYSTLPATWAGSKSASFPASVLQVISWNTADTNVVSFAKSIPAGVHVAWSYQSEQEAAYAGAAGAAQFVQQWDSQVTLLRSVGNPDFSYVPSSAAYQYTSGNSAAMACDYLPPKSYVTEYGVDVYQHEKQMTSASHGLSNYPVFQAWLHCVPQGARIAVTEYGVDASLSTAQRNTVIGWDASYLATLNPLVWVYWYYDTIQDPAHDYLFTDPPTIATWKGLATNGL